MHYNKEYINLIKERINLKEYISQYVELEKRGEYYFGVCPFHPDVNPSFAILNNNWRCYGCGLGGDIITFIIEYHKLSYNKAIKYIMEYTGIKDMGNIKVSQTFNFLKEFCSFKNKKQIIEREILPSNIMNKFRKTEIKEWTDEGISQKVLDKYQVRYDDNANRIVFPIWDNDGNLINIKGRTLYDNYRDLGISKYTYYYPLSTNNFLYGLSHKKDIIKKQNEVIVFEGSKSVYKMETWNFKNAVSLETSHLNSHQIDILLKLQVPIVLALDKDIKLDRIKENTKLLRKFTKVSVIYDVNNLLDEKDSPVDKGIFDYIQLYDERIWL